MTTTDPTTSAPELTALDDEALLDYYATLVAEHEYVESRKRAVEIRTERLNLRAELKRRLAAAERPATQPPVLYRSTRDIPSDDGHAHAWTWGDGEMYCAICEVTLVFAIDVVTAAERPVEGDTVTISVDDARRIAWFLLMSRENGSEAMRKKIQDAIALAASSAEPDAAPGQGDVHVEGAHVSEFDLTLEDGGPGAALIRFVGDDPAPAE